MRLGDMAAPSPDAATPSAAATRPLKLAESMRTLSAGSSVEVRLPGAGRPPIPNRRMHAGTQAYGILGVLRARPPPHHTRGSSPPAFRLPPNPQMGDTDDVALDESGAVQVMVPAEAAVAHVG